MIERMQREQSRLLLSIVNRERDREAERLEMLAAVLPHRRETLEVRGAR